MLELRSIKKDYITSSETVNALKGVDIVFRDKEFVSILGPSGCGKTTLLNIVGGLDRYTSGDLVINGKSTSLYRDRDWDVYRNHRVGFIFQSYNLIPHQTVLGNVELALTIAGIGKEERVARAKAALDKVGLSDQYYKKPNQLSGGQCQRVAIARALVNEPEILLADEPTGALDTVTSVQIMELIREIAGERLVIMVTHNPELAEQYSTRIIRLLDGNVIEDTNPVSEEEYAEAKAAEEKIAAEEASLVAALDKKEKKARAKKKEKAKMSVFTAFRLSARNLISKKGRTAMVGFAGSIGIIGIALVLAFSGGIKGYIASMQDDMLSGNPITISESTYDISMLSDMMKQTAETEDKEKIPGKVYISSLIEYIAKMDNTRESIAVENVITKEYIEYLKAMPKEYYKDILFDYGVDLNNGIYSNLKLDGMDEGRLMSSTAITAMYTTLLKETDFKDYADYVGMMVPSFSVLPSNGDYVLSQYDLVGENSKIATEKGEIMLVLNSEDELSDLLLARFGFYTREEFLEVVNKAVTKEKDEKGNPIYNEAVYREYFEYDDLIGKTLTWFPNDQIFYESETKNPMTNDYTYNAYGDELEGGTELTVVGILTPKDSVSFGSLSSGIYYTESFMDHVLAENKDSEIFENINAIDESNSSQMAAAKYYIQYKFECDDPNAPKEAPATKTISGSIGASTSMMDAMAGMMGGGSNTGIDHKEMKEKLIRALGGNDLANYVKIYPISFDDKNLVTRYLDRWNNDTEKDENGVERDIIITLGDGRQLTPDMRDDVTFTDTLELVINMVNTMIDIISYALIAFTSVSLVVSTVMIGIITYVSVVERIKEIGVIRSLGGRKRDVSNLFMAETFIIGSLAGLIGIGGTYLISAIVNIILKPLIGYPNIAALPVGNAIFLVCLSIGLTLISGLAPAKSAANKDPVVALRTE
mgnify:CR=1 FL=1